MIDHAVSAVCMHSETVLPSIRHRRRVDHTARQKFSGGDDDLDDVCGHGDAPPRRGQPRPRPFPASGIMFKFRLFSSTCKALCVLSPEAAFGPTTPKLYIHTDVTGYTAARVFLCTHRLRASCPSTASSVHIFHSELFLIYACLSTRLTSVSSKESLVV